MYTHVVLFDLKDDASRSEATALLESLKQSVPTLTHLEVGADDSPGPRSCDLCLITRFDSRADYEVYKDHPAHLAVVAQLKPMLTGARKVDW